MSAPEQNESSPPRRRQSDHGLSFRRRVMIGGAGALMPILLNLVIVDLHVVFRGADRYDVAGYVVRVSALFLIGALTAWLYKEENSEQKLFQLGIAAPALLTAMMNGVNVDSHKKTPAKEANVMSFVVTPLHAQQQRQQQQRAVPAVTDAPQLTPWQRFLRGLIGRDEHGPWFVALPTSFPTDTAATRAAENLRQRYDGEVKVYRAQTQPERFYVVLGAWLEGDDAQSLVTQMAQHGTKTVMWAPRSLSETGPP